MNGKPSPGREQMERAERIMRAQEIARTLRDKLKGVSTQEDKDAVAEQALGMVAFYPECRDIFMSVVEESKPRVGRLPPKIAGPGRNRIREEKRDEVIRNWDISKTPGIGKLATTYKDIAVAVYGTSKAED